MCTRKFNSITLSAECFLYVYTVTIDRNDPVLFMAFGSEMRLSQYRLSWLNLGYYYMRLSAMNVEVKRWRYWDSFSFLCIVWFVQGWIAYFRELYWQKLPFQQCNIVFQVKRIIIQLKVYQLHFIYFFLRILLEFMCCSCATMSYLLLYHIIA